MGNLKLFRPDGHMMRRKWLAAFVSLIIGGVGCGLAFNIIVKAFPERLVAWVSFLGFIPIISLAMAVEEWIDPPKPPPMEIDDPV